MPQFLLEAEPNQKPLQTIEAPIPLSDVRLVYPLPHPTTGVLRDVIIKELMAFTKNGDRFIAGMHPRVRIPYLEQPKMEEDEHDIDMLRIEVEDRTWTPTLFTAPMPESVINELRNKYGVFRVRHDDSFIAAKEDSERQQERLVKKRELRMLTPLEEFHQLERAKRKALGRESLDEEMLARIGEVMARNKGISMKEETSH